MEVSQNDSCTQHTNVIPNVSQKTKENDFFDNCEIKWLATQKKIPPV